MSDIQIAPSGIPGRVLNGALWVLDQGAAVCFALALLLNFANVVGRYVFHLPIFWAEEVTIILIIWSVCLMSFRLTLFGEHLVTDILRPYLAPRAQAVLLFATTALGAVLSGFIVFYAYKVVEFVERLGQVTIVAEMPKSWAYSSILVCFAFVVLASVLRLLALLRGAPLSPRSL